MDTEKEGLVVVVIGRVIQNMNVQCVFELYPAEESSYLFLAFSSSSFLPPPMPA